MKNLSGFNFFSLLFLRDHVIDADVCVHVGRQTVDELVVQCGYDLTAISFNRPLHTPASCRTLSTHNACHIWKSYTRARIVLEFRIFSTSAPAKQCAARYWYSSCVRPSICCLSVMFQSKRLKISSTFFHRPAAPPSFITSPN